MCNRPAGLMSLVTTLRRRRFLPLRRELPRVFAGVLRYSADGKGLKSAWGIEVGRIELQSDGPSLGLTILIASAWGEGVVISAARPKYA